MVKKLKERVFFESPLNTGRQHEFDLARAVVIFFLAFIHMTIECSTDANECEERLNRVKEAAYSLGVNKNIDPFMTLSFSSLAVIPTLRLTTLGVVDVTRFELLI